MLAPFIRQGFKAVSGICQLFPVEFSKTVNHRFDETNSSSRPFDFTQENYKKIQEVLAKYPKNQKRSAVMALLYLVQDQNQNWIPLSAMKKVAKILQISDMEVYEVATFYSMYNRQKVGKFHLQVCGTTPCRLCGSQKIIDTLSCNLKTAVGNTSADGLFTIDEVECLGACSNAPVMQVNNEKLYEDLSADSIMKLVSDLKEGVALPGPQNGRKNSEGIQGRTTLTGPIVNEWPERDYQAAAREWEEAKK